MSRQRQSQEPPEDIWANYDPDAVRAALRKLAGILCEVDTDALKREIKAARAQGGTHRPE